MQRGGSKPGAKPAAKQPTASLQENDQGEEMKMQVDELVEGGEPAPKAKSQAEFRKLMLAGKKK